MERWRGQRVVAFRTHRGTAKPSAAWRSRKADSRTGSTTRSSPLAVPCRHFDQGRGSCPFGSSCWYAHRYADGSEAGPAPLRKYGTADGELRVVEPVRLSAFLERHAER